MRVWSQGADFKARRDW